MSENSLKLELIEWLIKLKDKNILDSLLQFKKAEEQDWANDLTAEQQVSLERGLKDIKDNKVISTAALMSKYGRSK